MKRINKIARTLQALKACREKSAPGNPHPWVAKHEESLRELMRSSPSGSGFDSGTTLEEDESTPEMIVFSTSFHRMNDHGYYTGWTYHKITVTPSFVFGLVLKISGKNRDVKDYIHEVFYSWLKDEDLTGAEEC